MTSKKTPPPKPGILEKEGKRRPTLIAAAVIFGTFAAIVALSVITRGPDDNWPDWRLALIRIALLTVTSALYYLLLFRTRADGKEKEEKPKRKK